MGRLVLHGLLLRLPHEVDDVLGQAAGVALHGVDLVLQGLCVGELLVVELLLLALLCLQVALLLLELRLEILDGLDSLGVSVGGLACVEQAVSEILEARGIEDDGQHVRATGLVRGVDAVGQDVLGVGELGLLLRDGHLEIIDLGVRLVELGLRLAQRILGEFGLLRERAQL